MKKLTIHGLLCMSALTLFVMGCKTMNEPAASQPAAPEAVSQQEPAVETAPLTTDTTAQVPAE